MTLLYPLLLVCVPYIAVAPAHCTTLCPRQSGYLDLSWKPLKPQPTTYKDRPSHTGDLLPCPEPMPEPYISCRGHFHSHRQPGDVQLHEKMDKERMGEACSTGCPERRYREGCSADCHAHRGHDPHPHTGLSLLCPSVAFRDAAYMPLEIAGKDCLQATTFVCL